MIVQKFGGSSVGTPDKIKNVAARIARVRARGIPVTVVVSAMGHTTDELVSLAHQVTPLPNAREMDMLLSAGERVSMALLSMALRDLGHEAISFTGSQAGIITDESHTRARILEIKPIRVQEELARGKVVIIAGFQGVSRTKEVTTLGRGGSDTTAVALAAALKAECCEVYTDVAGIYSADPGVVKSARRYERLPLDLMFEMTVKGAQVMHARSIEIARERDLPVYVGMAHPLETVERTRMQRAQQFTMEGTMLVSETKVIALELPKIVAVASRGALVALQFDAALTESLLAELSASSILVHNVTLTPTGGLMLLVDPVEATTFLERHSQNITARGLASVSVIGYQLQQNVRVPAQIISLLSKQGIPVAGLTCHPQSITVWFPDSQLNNLCERAVNCLHDALISNVTG